MPMELTRAHEQLRVQARDFAHERIRPCADELEGGDLPACEAASAELWAAAAERGWTGLTVSETAGGAGLDTVGACLVLEEVSRESASFGLLLAGQSLLVGDLLERFASASQIESWLSPLAQGRQLGCLARCEGEARPSGDGHSYRLEGVSQVALGASRADLALVVVPVARGGGSTVFCLETGGLRKQSAPRTLGVRGDGCGRLVFGAPGSGIEVSAGRRLGAEGQGEEIEARAREGARLGLAAVSLGIAQKAFEVALEHAPGSPLVATSQALQFYLADMSTEVDAARLLMWKAAWARDHRKRHTLETSQARLFAAQAAARATDRALRICPESPVLERLFGDARACELPGVLGLSEETREAQKRAIAGSVLEVPAQP